MTSEAVSRALLGVITLESLEEKETKNKRGKTRRWIQKREEKGFYTNIVEGHKNARRNVKNEL